MVSEILSTTAAVPYRLVKPLNSTDATCFLHEVLAYTAGKMRKFRIRTGVGDRVIVEMSPYDLQRGRISFRHKGDAPAPAPQQRRPNFRGRR